MSEEVREDDEWLYEGGGGGGGGNSNNSNNADLPQGPGGPGEGVEGEEEVKAEVEGEEGGGGDQTTIADGVVDGEGGGGGEGEDKNGEESEEEDEEEDSDDDDDDGVQVVIGDTKAASGGQIPFGTGVGVGTKRPAPAPDKKGKFSVDDFETPGTINGISALEFSIDGIEDKPWRQPGADITDYFNYGFTEETWRAYTERQKRMRYEAGAPQILNTTGPKQQDNRGIITVAFGGGQHQHMQNQRMDMMMQRRREEPKENTIQVMTADRREYSRKNFEMGMGPPPGMPPPFNPAIPPPNFPPPGHPGGHGGHGPPGPEFMNPEFFNHPPPPQFYQEEPQGYEEQQWMDHHTEAWDMGGMAGPPTSSSLVSLTKVANVPPPPGDEDVKHERKD